MPWRPDRRAATSSSASAGSWPGIPELRAARCCGIGLAIAGIVAGGCRTAGERGAASPADPFRLDAPQQVLFRGEARNGDDSARLRLTLRRWSVTRFELQASDLLGRGVWSLAIGDGVGLWRDLRADTACRFSPASRVRLGDADLALPADALPAVLLGDTPVRLQNSPAGPQSAADLVSLVDDGAWRWRIVRDANGGVIAWQLDEEGATRLEWERDGERRRLRSADPPFEIEWREVARERLTAAVPDLTGAVQAVPECADANLP